MISKLRLFYLPINGKAFFVEVINISIESTSEFFLLKHQYFGLFNTLYFTQEWYNDVTKLFQPIILAYLGCDLISLLILLLRASVTCSIPPTFSFAFVVIWNKVKGSRLSKYSSFFNILSGASSHTKFSFLFTSFM